MLGFNYLIIVGNLIYTWLSYDDNDLLIINVKILLIFDFGVSFIVGISVGSNNVITIFGI